MELSKKLLFFSWGVTLILTILLLGFSIAQLPLDGLIVVTPLSWTETGVATGYYYWKSKNENRAKYGQAFLKAFAKEWGPDVALRMAEIVLKKEEFVSLALRALYEKFGYLPYNMSKFEPYDLYVRNKDFLVSDNIITFTDTDGKLMACSAKLRSDFQAGSDNIVLPYEFYFGPNDYKTLKKYDQKYEKIIPLGGWLVAWFSRLIIIPTFDFLGRFLTNYGLIILLMTLFIKLLISPLTIKSYKSSAKMQVIKPEMDKINAKYPNEKDAMKKQQATMDLYQKAGISPMGGCLPMLLQMPILFAMFRFFPASIELRQQKFLWADDLSAYDSIWDFGVNIPLLGDHLSLFALLMAVTMFFYSKMTSGQMSDDPNMAGMKFMSVWLMPIMMFFICNNLSAALSYYYLLSNIITMIMTWYIRKYVVTEDKVRAEMVLNANKPKKKSTWQQRLEEAQKMQEQMQKQQKRK